MAKQTPERPLIPEWFRTRSEWQRLAGLVPRERAPRYYRDGDAYTRRRPPRRQHPLYHVLDIKPPCDGAISAAREVDPSWQAPASENPLMVVCAARDRLASLGHH